MLPDLTYNATLLEMKISARTSWLLAEEIAWTLQTLSVNALELSRMWEQSGFSTLVLTDVSEQGFLEQLPMQADNFRQYQAECTEVVKSMLWTSWAPKSVELFNRLPPVFINGDSVRCLLQSSRHTSEQPAALPAPALPGL
eukprot:scaffold304370_cov19-Tisochrysis_lutea.AAC.1